jgi:gamma-glutamylcyclotransferase (GGCT)/AIG2-like uncharacterized protein YtfP
MDSSVVAAETNGFSREGTVAGDLSLSTSGAFADFNKAMANAASPQLLEAWRNKNTTSNNSASSVSSAILPAPSRIKPVEYIMSRKTSSSRSLAFVYGTLKQGFSNHWLMEDVMTKGHARFVGIASTKKQYPLVCGPFQVPFLLDMPACGCHVRGELYEVSQSLGPSRKILFRTFGSSAVSYVNLAHVKTDISCTCEERYHQHMRREKS